MNVREVIYNHMSSDPLLSGADYYYKYADEGATLPYIVQDPTGGSYYKHAQRDDESSSGHIDVSFFVYADDYQTCLDYAYKVSDRVNYQAFSEGGTRIHKSSPPTFSVEYNETGKFQATIQVKLFYYSIE